MNDSRDLVSSPIRPQTRAAHLHSHNRISSERLTGLSGLCDFDWRCINRHRRNMLLGRNLRRTSQNSRDLASGLKRVRFAQLYQPRQTLFDRWVKYSSRRWCKTLSPAFFVFPKRSLLVFTRANALWPTPSRISGPPSRDSLSDDSSHLGGKWRELVGWFGSTSLFGWETDRSMLTKEAEVS